MIPLEKWIAVLTACVPIFVALVGIIPTIISNRKKTQDSIQNMKNELVSDIKSTKKEVADVQKSFNEHVSEYEENRAKQTRYRILRFYDEVCEGKLHSESHYEDVLDDIDFYEMYCVIHPEFKNNRGKAAMEHIKSTYAKIKAKGAFLTHSDET